MRVRSSISNIIPFIIGFITCVIMASQAFSAETYSNRVFFTSMIIQLFSIYCIFSRSEEPFSLYKMFFLFSLFFYGIAPLLQFFGNALMWTKTLTSEAEFFYCNLVVIIIIFLYHIFYLFIRKLKFSNKSTDRYLLTKKTSYKKIAVLLMLSATAFLIVLSSNGFNIYAMILRGGELVTNNAGDTGSEGSPTIWLLINNFIRPISIMCFLFYTISPQKSKLISGILLILALLTCFPSSMPRFAAAAMYIPVLLITVSLFKKKNIFSYIFVVGLLFVFPLLNNFRSFSTENKFTLDFDFEMFLTQHFDSFQNFALLLSNDIVTYGRQLLGVVFFWLPRSIWIDKPIGSGSYMAEKLNFVFNNISMNFFAEGYINFGFLGVLIFIIVLAYSTAKLDKLYWKSVFTTKNNYFSVLYTVSLGFLFFILRGDLLSSIAYLSGFLAASVFIFKIAK